MTRDEILNMPAGREMDALVALHVFGEEKYEQYIYMRQMKTLRGIRTNYWKLEKALPEYSDNIAAAWEVVKHPMFKRFQIDHADDRGEKWFASCSTLTHAFSATADTAYLAICRATLLAVMENE